MATADSCCCFQFGSGGSFIYIMHALGGVPVYDCCISVHYELYFLLDVCWEKSKPIALPIMHVLVLMLCVVCILIVWVYLIHLILFSNLWYWRNTWDNQAEAVFISHCANTLGKDMNLTIIYRAMGKQSGRLGTLTLVWQLV